MTPVVPETPETPVVVTPETPVSTDDPWAPPGEEISVSPVTPVTPVPSDDPWAPPSTGERPVVVDPEDELWNSGSGSTTGGGSDTLPSSNTGITLADSGHPHTWTYPTGRKIQPSDVYTPSATSGETFTYGGRQVPIYSQPQSRQVRSGDFYWSGGRLRYSGSRYTATFGVDVSAYQNRNRSNSTINWTAAKNDGVQFAMVRAAVRLYGSAGTLSADQYYARNIDGARAVGLYTGSYVFSTAISVEEALEEADMMIRLLRGHDINGPVCYDWEINGSSYRNANVSKEMATACAIAFCERMKEAGYTPMVYMSQLVGYTKYDMGALRTYLKWYPQYPSRSTASPYPNFRYQMDIWQYSSSTTVEGIGTNIDVNLWFWPK